MYRRLTDLKLPPGEARCSKRQERIIARNGSLIISDPEILSGKPVAKGTRISVALILHCLASGMTGKRSSVPSLEGSEAALEKTLIQAGRIIANPRRLDDQLLELIGEGYSPKTAGKSAADFILKGDR